MFLFQVITAPLDCGFFELAVVDHELERIFFDIDALLGKRRDAALGICSREGR
jgi:hypothetical protein